MNAKGEPDDNVRLIGWRKRLVQAIERQRNLDPKRPRTFVVHFPHGFGSGAVCQVFDTTPAGRIDLDADAFLVTSDNQPA